MDPIDKKRIRANHRELVRTVRPKDIVDYLYEKEVINEEVLDQVDHKRVTHFEGMRILIKVVTQQKYAFSVLCEALEESGQEFLAKKLRETVVDDAAGDSVDAADVKDEKIEQLEAQLKIQTDLLLRYNQDFKLLSQKFDTEIDSKKELEIKVVELEKGMVDNGLKEEKVVKYIKEYMVQNSKQAMFDKFRQPKVHADPFGGGRSQSVNQLVEAVANCNFSDPVEYHAREIGKDLVKYIVHKSRKIPTLKCYNKYAFAMRTASDQISSKYRETFDTFMDSLKIEETPGYAALLQVAEAMFGDRITNWGRIVAVYTFGGWVASYQEEEGANFMGEFIGYYISKRHRKWISDNGGWDDFANKWGPTWYQQMSMSCSIA